MDIIIGLPTDLDRHSVQTYYVNWIIMRRKAPRKIWTWRSCRIPVQRCWRRLQGSILCSDWRCFSVSEWLFSFSRFEKVPKDIQYADNWRFWIKRLYQRLSRTPWLCPWNAIASVCSSLQEIDLSEHLKVFREMEPNVRCMFQSLL